MSLPAGVLTAWRQPEGMEPCLPPTAATTSGSINSLLQSFITRRLIIGLEIDLTFNGLYLWLAEQRLVCKMRHLASINAPNGTAVQSTSPKISDVKSTFRTGLNSIGRMRRRSYCVQEEPEMRAQQRHWQ
jgi:hypothetical protein